MIPTQEEILKLRFAIEGEAQAEGLRARIGALEDHIRGLQSTLKATPPTSPLFASIDAAVDSNIAHLIRLRDELAKAERQAAGSSLVGAERSATKARGALAGANILQDAIQGGPASTINNLLGIAGDRKLLALGKELGGSFVAAAGGAGALAATLGTVAAVAGAAFLLIDGGLKNAKLGWSDLDDVVGNLAPIAAAGEALAGVGEIAKQWGITKAVEDAYSATETFVGWVAQSTIGWNDATAAVRAHKDEVARATQEAADYAAAVKNLKSVRSDEQEAAAKTGKLVGGELANLGGAGGVDALAAKLAEVMTKTGANDKVKVQEVTKEDGKEVTKEVEVTRRESARRRALTDIDRANSGDTQALSRLMPALKKAGYDVADLNTAAGGEDPAKKRQDAIDAAEEQSWQELQESIKSVKDWSKDFKDQVKAALKDRSFLQGGDLTPAQEAAKRQYDALEERVAEARASRSYAGKEDEALAPAEKLAKGRDEDARRAADKVEADHKQAENRQQALDRQAQAAREGKEREERDALSAQLDNTPLDDRVKAELLQRQLGGQSANQAGAALTSQLAGVFREQFGLADEQARKEAEDRVRGAQGDLRRDALRPAGDARSQTFGDARQFLDAIQGGVTQDLAAKSLTVQEQIRDGIRQILDSPQARQQLAATFS